MGNVDLPAQCTETCLPLLQMASPNGEVVHLVNTKGPIILSVVRGSAGVSNVFYTKKVTPPSFISSDILYQGSTNDLFTFPRAGLYRVKAQVSYWAETAITGRYEIRAEYWTAANKLVTNSAFVTAAQGYQLATIDFTAEMTRIAKIGTYFFAANAKATRFALADQTILNVEYVGPARAPVS